MPLLGPTHMRSPWQLRLGFLIRVFRTVCRRIHVVLHDKLMCSGTSPATASPPSAKFMNASLLCLGPTRGFLSFDNEMTTLCMQVEAL